MGSTPVPVVPFRAHICWHCRAVPCIHTPFPAGTVLGKCFYGHLPYRGRALDGTIPDRPSSLGGGRCVGEAVPTLRHVPLALRPVPVPHLCLEGHSDPPPLSMCGTPSHCRPRRIRLLAARPPLLAGLCSSPGRQLCFPLVFVRAWFLWHAFLESFFSCSIEFFPCFVVP